MLLVAALLGGCSGPAVAPITVRYVGPVGLQAVRPETVELVRGKEVRSHTAIAELEVVPDGSTYEVLVERLRQRAASLGADAICDVHSVFDVGSGQVSSDPRTTPETPEDTLIDAAKAGFSVFLNRPSWIAVRGTAIRLDDIHRGENAKSASAPSTAPSTARDVLHGDPPETRPDKPQEKPRSKNLTMEDPAKRSIRHVFARFARGCGLRRWIPIPTLFLAACASMYPVEIETLSATTAPARDPRLVDVLHSMPTRPFVEVARLATSSMNYDSPAAAVSKLRYAAAELGADALIIEAEGTRAAAPTYPGTSNTDADFGFGPAVPGRPNVGIQRDPIARGTAIRWTGPRVGARASDH
mgnify:CR=1 FL=1